MSPPDDGLPDDPEELRQMVRALQVTVVSERERASFFQREYERLARQAFGLFLRRFAFGLVGGTLLGLALAFLSRALGLGNTHRRRKTHVSS